MYEENQDSHPQMGMQGLWPSPSLVYAALLQGDQVKKRTVVHHFCSRWLEVFKALTEEPDHCTRCGAANWNELKRYTKEGDGQTPDAE